MEAQKHRPKSHRDKREQIHKLRKRNADLLQEHKRIGEHNAVIENKISAIEKEIRRFRAVNVELAEKVESEYIKEQTFKATIEKLDREAQNLEQTYLFQKNRFDKKAARTERLERELEKLMGKKQAYINLIQRASGNEAALKIREDNLKKALARNDDELKTLEGKRNAAPAGENLRERVRRMAGVDLKEGSALYHCVREIIQNMEENEFEGLTYKTRVNKNKNKMGARLYFQNVSSQYSDLYRHLRPVILRLGQRFNPYGAEIQTCVKRGAGGVVTALDITVVVRLAQDQKAAKAPQAEAASRL
ncbi:MAG: hypothetical protein WD025_06135 [Bacteriovoracaceae bacterium]